MKSRSGAVRRSANKAAKAWMATALALVVAAGSLALSTNAEASRLKKIQFGGWKGGVYINDKTGAFSHCVVSAKYKSGITLLFSVTKGQQWSMGFSKPGWRFEVGKRYPVLYQVDKRKVLKGNAKARTTKLVAVALPAKAAIFNQMRRGRTLRIKAGKDLLVFNLTGTSRMLKGLLRCSEQNNDLRINTPSANNNGSGTGNNPFEEGKQTAKVNAFGAGQGVPRDHKQEALRWFKQHLANSTVKYATVKENAKSAKLYKTYALVWGSGDKNSTIGSMRILNSRLAKTIEKELMGYRAKNCKGSYASRILPTDIDTSRKLLRFTATCKQGDKPAKTYYHILTDRENGGAYFISLISDKVTADQVAEIGEDVTTRILNGGFGPVIDNSADDTTKDASDTALEFNE